MYVKIKNRRRARFYAIQAMYQKSICKTPTTELKDQFYNDNVKRSATEWCFFNKLLDLYKLHKNIINKKIDQYNNKTQAIDLIELSILRLGSCELLNDLDIPYQIILGEYINNAKIFGAEGGYKFVNGVLEKLAKDFRGNQKILD